MNLAKQRFFVFFRVLLAEKRYGILDYLLFNFGMIAMPVVVIYFLLKFVRVGTDVRADYIIYLYASLFYFCFIFTIPEKVIRWFFLEIQRGTIEVIYKTQLGIKGTIQYFILIFSLVFFLFQAPLYIIFLKYIFDFTMGGFFTFPAFIFIALNILLIYAVALLGVSSLLFFDINPLNAQMRRVLYIITGVYCPVTVFPFSLKIISFALPFTHGLILFRKIFISGEIINFVDFIPFILFSGGLCILGHFLFNKTILFIQQKRSFLN